jgi:S-DNA-T family DNA segregation ATPase FtsK/SpoIIIE
MGNDAIMEDGEDSLLSSYTDDGDNWPEMADKLADEKPKVEVPKQPVELTVPDVKEPVKPVKEIQLEVETPAKKEEKKEPVFTIEEPTETDKLADQLVEEHGFYDPTLDLGSFKFPPLELLREYETSKVQVTQDELNQNKYKIVATLINFKIGIQSIKATIGPTVTLY